MATFNPKSFEKKLKSLDPTQTAIQTLSLWILHHRHHAEPITTTWLEQIRKTTKPEKKLGLFYLVNDVVQNGRRKAKELVTAFGGVLLEALPLLRDTKIKNQIERVFNIWLERNVYDNELIDTFKQRIEPSPVKVKPEKKVSTSKQEKAPAVRKTVPANFKVSSLLVSIKKATNYDNEVDRKSNALDKLKIDASSFDSVKHVKDRSSVGRFHKQFEESKILLEDYIQTLRRCQRDKIVLMALLSGSEVFYEVAQEEAKVIVNAYKTFGNRLNSMKKKLDSKIRRMEDEAPVESSQSEDNVTDDNIEIKEESGFSTSENINIQDMDLDSDSDNDMTDRYDLLNAPVDRDDTYIDASPRAFSSTESQDDSFNKKFQSMDSIEEVREQSSAASQHQENIFGSPEAAQKEQQEFISFHNQLLLSQQKPENLYSNILPHQQLQRQPSLQESTPTKPEALAMIGLAKQGPSVPLQPDAMLSISKHLHAPTMPTPPIMTKEIPLHEPELPKQQPQPQAMQISPRMIQDPFAQTPQQPPVLPVICPETPFTQQPQPTPASSPPTVTGLNVETQQFYNGVTSIYDFPGMPVTSTLGITDESGAPSSEGSIDLQHASMMERRLDNTATTPDGLIIAEDSDPATSVDGVPKVPSSSALLQNFQVIPNNMTPDQTMSGGNPSYAVNSNLPTPVQDEHEKMSVDKNDSLIEIQKKQQPLQSLIDSLFPVLSKSLQTIKEKQQAVAADEGAKPSVSEAMAFALGSPSTSEDVPRKKGRFGKELSPSPVTSPLSLTNPKGLSENQTELISIAAGLTKFDENFLPVTTEESKDTQPLEDLAVSQAPIESAEDDPVELIHEETPKEKENDDHEKKREDRKSRHSSGRHRSSHKDEDRRKHSSSSPSRRSSHREEDRHKKSSSRSPSRRNSHRSSRDSRDDRHSERRRSRRSPSPRRRKSSRGRRSQSREREDTKRRRSPDRAPYYNDRRSPTPEMDSSPRPSAFTANVISNQIVNPMIQNQAFQIPSSSISTTLNMEEQNQIQESPNGPAFINSGVVINSGIYQSSEESGLNVSSSTGPNSMIPLTSNAKDDDPMNNGAKPPDITTILQMANQLRPVTMQVNQSSLEGSVGPAILNYDSVGRPMLLPGIQIRNANPVQVLQPRGDQPGILHLRPLPPGVIPINPGQNIIGGMGGQLIMQDDLTVKPIDHTQHESETEVSPNGAGTSVSENPIQKLSKLAQQEENEFKRDALLPASFEPPPQPPAPGNLERPALLQRPPMTFPPPVPPEFRPRFGGGRPVPPRVIFGQMDGGFEERGAPPPPERPRFDGPRHPRFEGPRGPRFEAPRSHRFDGPRGPRFDGHRPPPRFDGPKPPRFDGPPRPPRFDGPPRPPLRFEPPNDIGHNSERIRFDGPPPRFDGPRPRFDGPRDMYDRPPHEDSHHRDGPRDGKYERKKDGFYDGPMQRPPKCAEPDPLLDQLEAQQKQERHQSNDSSPQQPHMTPPRMTPPRMTPPRQEQIPTLPPRNIDEPRPKFKPASFSEVRPFNEPPRPRFRPRFSGPRGFRFRPRFERPRFRPPRPSR